MPALDPTVPDEREARLPQWAQGTINGLRRRLRDAETAAEEARLATRPDESDTVIKPFDTEVVGLGIGPRVAFRLTGTKAWPAIIARVTRRGTLSLMGDNALIIHPSSSNSVEILMEGK